LADIGWVFDISYIHSIT